jgi:protein with PEP-CTERM/exosortase system signal
MATNVLARISIGQNGAEQHDMKKLFAVCATVLWFASHASVANASIIDLGIWDPVPPLDSQAIALCALISGQTATDELTCLNNQVIPFYNVQHNPDLPLATFGTENIDTPTSPTSITLNLTGDFSYVKLKWDGLWQYYYIAGTTGSTTFNSTVFNNVGQPQGLSHYTFFGPGGGSVPDGGATASLLGVALFGLGLLRRRLS